MTTTKTMPLFPLGRTVATHGALEALADAGQTPLPFLRRHARGDWGLVDKADARANDEAVRARERILSVYRTAKGVHLWVITEADRSATTLLLPSDY